MTCDAKRQAQLFPLGAQEREHGEVVAAAAVEAGGAADPFLGEAGLGQDGERGALSVWVSAVSRYIGSSPKARSTTASRAVVAWPCPRCWAASISSTWAVPLTMFWLVSAT